MPARAAPSRRDGSIIVVVATDAPLLPHQLEAPGAARAALGLARDWQRRRQRLRRHLHRVLDGKPGRGRRDRRHAAGLAAERRLTPFFEATVQATEEAIVNALVAAETMVGINGNTVPALPTDQLRAILTKYNRLNR